jgi:hypothetical protein
MGRDEKHDEQSRSTNYQDPVGVAWRDGNIYDDREGIARTWQIVRRALRIGEPHAAPAAGPSRSEPPER